MRIFIYSLAVSIALAGCASSAGPFVTSVSSDGRGGLVIEKCMARYDRWLATMENADCRSTTIHLRQ